MIDLARIAKLAAEATPGERSVRAIPLLEEARVYIDGRVRAYLDGRLLLGEQADAAFIAALDPATVTALVRLGQAAQELSRHVFAVDSGRLLKPAADALDEALAPFRGDA